MSWTDRLRPMEYRSPSGATFSLLFDEVARTGGKKAPVTEYPLQDQAGVQDLGNLTPRYQVVCYISGPDYDTESDRFWDSLDETGIGRLTHPRWGVIEVVPLSKEQREGFVEGASRAVFNIGFIRASERAFAAPRVLTSTDDRISALAAAADEQNVATLDGVDTTDPRQQAAISDAVTESVALAETQVQSFVTDQDILSAFSGAVSDITRNIDTLMETPLDLAERIAALYQIPPRSVISILAKINGYTTIFNGFRSTFLNIAATYGEFAEKIAALFMRTTLTSVANATTTGTIPTRSDAQRVVDALSSLRASVIADIETIESAPDYTGERLSEQALSRAIENIIDRSLSLPTERVLILDRSVTPLTLAWELYGGIDRLDELIDYNGFGGNQLLILDHGTEVRWYV